MLQARHAAVIFAAATWCAAPASAEPLDVDTGAVYLNADDVALVQVGQLRFHKGLALRSRDPRFGGLSGLVISPDGSRATMVGDVGHWFTARLKHDSDGVLTGLHRVTATPLTGADGQPLTGTGRKAMRDAEAVELLADGSLLVSFERRHRLLRYAPGDDALARTPTPHAVPSRLGEAPDNAGLEALAPLPDGRLLALTEGMRDQNGDLVGWLIDGDGSHTLRYAPTGLFKPTNAAALPNGDVLVLERRYTPIGGAAGRIALIRADSIRPGARLQTEQLALLEPPMTVDNFEGLALRPARAGGWWLYVLSDDNFNPLQRTLLLQFHWAGG